MDALVPKYFDNPRVLHVKTGISYPTVLDWANGKGNPRPDTLEKIVEVVAREHGVTLDPIDLYRGAGTATAAKTLSAAPGWAEAAAQAEKAGVESWVIEQIGALAGWQPAKGMTTELVRELALVILRHTPIEEVWRRNAESVRARSEAATPTPPTAPPRPRKS
jgi:hypothetical protein